jgi:Transposase and inactivated derivatives
MCDYFKISRSGYYKQLKSIERNCMEETIVIDLVQQQRHLMPRIGGKKLYFVLKDDLQVVGKTGRDKFFDILRKYNLLVKRKRSYTKTTNSYHRFRCWKNLIKDKKMTRPSECWVSDITYLRTLHGFVYLFLITDLYSRKIVGWNLNKSLSIEGGLLALSMALRQRQDKTLPLTHHSDRGIQYCCNTYVKQLQNNKIEISMTEENHCYENSTAERVNGILKDEFLLDSVFKDYNDATKAVKDAIQIYNDYRPHWSLDLRTPSAVHQQDAA